MAINNDFTHAIARTVKQDDAHQWTIGDALREDISVGDGKPKFSECAKVLRSVGFTDYNPHRLNVLYKTAERFPKADRDPAISWEAHKEARHPENLRRAAQELRDIGKTVNEINGGRLCPVFLN